MTTRSQPQPASNPPRASRPSGSKPRGDRRASDRSAVVAGLVLGIAASGFFDGILLHQVLQWHHLLSLVPGEPFRDPRVQVYADGMFHALMYGLLILGLWFAWRERAAVARPETARSVCVAFAAGFGAWNVADVVIFHWLLNIHNVRLDVPNPLAWDTGWLVVFGIAPLGLAAALYRNPRAGRGRSRTAAALALVTLGAGGQNLAPPTGNEIAVLFRPGVSETARMHAVARVGGRLVGSDSSGDLIVLQAPANAPLWKLYLDGALVVGGTVGGGCLNGTRVVTDGAGLASA